jgi:hypothetical protein
MRQTSALHAVICIFLAASLSACSQYNRTDDFMRSEDNYGTKEAQRIADNRTYSLNHDGRALPKNSGPLLVSEQAGHEVAKVEGIASAFVIIADNNAYVAVMPDNSATGIFTDGGGSRRRIDNTGLSEGGYASRSGRSYKGPDLLATDYYATQRKERLSERALQTIGTVVREVHPTVLQVYISSNRDFMNGVTRIMQAYWSGKPIQSYAEPFRDLVRRTFPPDRAG